MFGKKKQEAEAPQQKKTAAKAGTAGKQAGVAEVQGEKPDLSKMNPRDAQEHKRAEYIKAREEQKRRLLEAKKKKLEQERALRAEMKKRHTITMITFCIGLVVMLTTLIFLFPSTEMIIFSTLLMCTFFFLGISYQRMIMQLLVVALACMMITGAFYTIINGGIRL